jgi:hypothetical protein
MIVEKNKSLILWPSLKNYGLEKGELCNKIFNNNDFTIHVKFSVKKLDTYNNEPIIIFWKMPHVCSVSFDPHSYTNENNETIDSHLFFTNYTLNGDDIKRTGVFIDFEFDKQYEITITYSIEEKIIKYYLNDELKFEVNIDTEFFNEYDNPQILLGRNLFDIETTYEIDFEFLLLSKNILIDSQINSIELDYLKNLNEYGEYINSNDYGLLGLYDFKKVTKFKVFDFTGNNNHIYIEKNRT